MKYVTVILLVFFAISCNQHSKPLTDVSLFLRSDSLQVSEIRSEKANMYHEVGHHGPAIENEFYALRLYFNNSGSIDVYSKSRQQLELRETLWYPDSIMQNQGYGSDQYKVGKTVGLGGIKLWDDDKIIDLVATKGRTATVGKQDGCAIMEMIGYGVAYQNDLVDIKIKVTLCPADRWAKVEAFSLTGKEVQFVTGINFHVGQEFIAQDNYAIAWGLHPEDVAISQLEIGGAFFFDKSMFVDTKKLDDQLVCISRPATHLTSYITSVSEKDPELNSLPKFEKFVSQSSPTFK